MKLLIINGTPKLDGVCYSFVEAAEEIAAELSVDFETIRLSSERLMKCIMCDGGWGICYKEHRCIFGEKDGFTALQKKMAEADLYVYITPVYWGEISEEMKIFIDKLRRCEATKQWDRNEPKPVSSHKGKGSILVASAGGGGGGTLSALEQLERAVVQMGGDEWPREQDGIFDYIAVNRWNQSYKRDTLKSAISDWVAIYRGEKTAPDMNKGVNERRE
ncbi:MAG: NAD(P)H-dependent oxidoreductase [Turicibacter sp.]|nr:NAD(P)H-dependent oxidoreductase [Turicibacter sp.]